MRPDECRVCWEPICIHTPQLFVVCEDCGTSTKLFYSEPEDAVKAWNDGEVCSE